MAVATGDVAGEVINLGTGCETSVADLAAHDRPYLRQGSHPGSGGDAQAPEMSEITRLCASAAKGAQAAGLGAPVRRPRRLAPGS